MKDLITSWIEFRKWWRENGKRSKLDGEEFLVRPQFDDFMNWLARQIEH